MLLLKKTYVWALSHKVISIILLLVLVFVGWFAYSKLTSTAGITRYVLGTVSSSTIVATITASGQVSANNQLEIKPKASGDIVYIDVQSGQKVAAGALIAQIDTTDAQKTIRDATASLQSAEISLKKIQQPADTLTLTQAQNAATNAKDSLATAYTNANNDISTVFLGLPDIVSGIQEINTGTATNRSAQWNVDFYKNIITSYSPKGTQYRDDSYNSYRTAQTTYDSSSALYKSTTLTDNNTDAIEKLLASAYSTTKATFEATKQASALIQLYEDTLKTQNQTPIALADTQLSTLAGYTTKLNGYLSTLLADINTISDDKQKITETAQSLAKTQKGSDELDVQSAQLNVTRAQNTLTDAQNTLADYYVRAPFAGTIAAINVKKFDSANSGTALATLVTSDQLATLSVNEVDAAKIAVGQQATLTFDAIDGLSIAGKVASIDTIGAVSQGVVSYTVKINFTTQDARVKPGMTVNASIITATAIDALTVPSSAVKTQNGESTVLVFQPALIDSGTSQGVISTLTPVSIPVTTGISDDTSVEILSGLSFGQQIVVRTLTGAAATSAATTRTTNARPGSVGGIRLGG